MNPLSRLKSKEFFAEENPRRIGFVIGQLLL
jgi:hypothetical protein